MSVNSFPHVIFLICMQYDHVALFQHILFEWEQTYWQFCSAIKRALILGVAVVSWVVANILGGKYGHMRGLNVQIGH